MILILARTYTALLVAGLLAVLIVYIVATIRSCYCFMFFYHCADKSTAKMGFYHGQSWRARFMMSIRSQIFVLESNPSRERSSDKCLLNYQSKNNNSINGCCRSMTLAGLMGSVVVTGSCPGIDQALSLTLSDGHPRLVDPEPGLTLTQFPSYMNPVSIQVHHHCHQ